MTPKMAASFLSTSLARRVSRIAAAAAAVLLAGAVAFTASEQATASDTDIPNMVGTWVGENKTISDKKGLRTWKKTIEITEQTDRRFRGHFDYSAGRKNFFGIVYPDNVSFSWVASDSKGYNHGRILGSDAITACYVESGEDATAGCARLVRAEQKK